MAEYLYLELPLPPTVNKMFSNIPGRGRVKSLKYRQWLEAAGWELKSQIGGKRVAGPIGVTIKLVKPSKRKTDLDNRLKGLLDLLVTNNVIDDDSDIQRIHAEWVPDGAPCQVMVISTREVEPIGAVS